MVSEIQGKAGKKQSMSSATLLSRVDGRSRNVRQQVNFGREDSIGFQMQITLKSFRQMLQASIATENVNIGTWLYLRVLWEGDGLTQRELTERVGLQQPTTVSALRSMEADGLVTLINDPHDRRKIRVMLTEKAKKLGKRLAPRVAYINEGIAYNGFSSSERKQFLDMLLRMKTNIDTFMKNSPEGVGSERRLRKGARLIDVEDIGL